MSGNSTTQASHTGDRDVGARSLRDHDWNDVLHGEHYAAHVSIENGCELLGGQVFNSDHGSADASIVHEAVQSAEPVDGMVDHGHDARFVSHISAYETQRVAAARL